MGRRGPSPSPTASLRILGREDRTVSIHAEPIPPDWLSDPGREQWILLVAVLRDFVSPIDQNAMAVYCQAIADYKEQMALVLEEGWLVQGDRGMVKNPRSQIVRELRETILAFSREFGLTPSSRSKIKPGGGSEDSSTRDPLGSFASVKDDDRPPAVEVSSG